MSDVVIKQEIDARGSACPGPLMELIRGVRASGVGEAVAVLSSDQGSRVDIPEWVQKVGYELVSVEDKGEYSRFVIRKTH